MGSNKATELVEALMQEIREMNKEIDSLKRERDWYRKELREKEYIEYENKVNGEE